MYIQRSIDQQLLEWKQGNVRKPLLLRGARQVGKSSAVRHLGETLFMYLSTICSFEYSANYFWHQQLKKNFIFFFNNCLHK